MANMQPATEADIFEEIETGKSGGVADDDQTSTPPPPEPPPAEQQSQTPEPPAEPAPAPAPAPADNPAANAPKGYVPTQALTQARLQNERLQGELSQVQSSMNGIKEQLMELRKSHQQQDEFGPEPDKEQDPMGHLEWTNKRISKQIRDLAEKDSQANDVAKANQEQQQQISKLMNDIRTNVLEFEAGQPDYSKAFLHVMQNRMNEYAALGIADPMQQQAMFDREVLALCASALQRGMNPGQAMYNLAKAQGYTNEIASNEPAPQSPNLAKNDQTLAQHMDRLEKANTAGSLSNVGGETPDVEPDINAVLTMSDSDFDNWWAQQTGGNSIY